MCLHYPWSYTPYRPKLSLERACKSFVCLFVYVCVFVQIRQRVLTEATFNKAELTKLIGERWVGFDDADWNLRTFEEKRDNERCV